MQIFTTVKSWEKTRKKWRDKNQKSTLVATMGGLHRGHLALVEKAQKTGGPVVVSIFVNPTQFGENEDFERYPRNLNNDFEKLKKARADAVFAPDVAEIYPPKKTVDSPTKKMPDFAIGAVGEILCGKFRPGHFAGVLQVVGRLFEIIRPAAAIFGAKDYQQLFIIRRFVGRANYPIEIIEHPTVREKDGLALSTRNQYLSNEERKIAPRFYQALCRAGAMMEKNYSFEMMKKRTISELIETVKKRAVSKLSENFRVEYLEILDANTLGKITTSTDKIAILSAVYLGRTRLIDHIEMALR